MECAADEDDGPCDAPKDGMKRLQMEIKLAVLGDGGRYLPQACST